MNTLKKDGVYWIDENHNKWSEYHFTEEEVLEASKTLVDCYYCTDCTNCRYCRDCNKCDFCTVCYDCKRCKKTAHSDYCADCSECFNCHACHSCNFCIDCNNLVRFKKNPARYITKKIANRSPICFYWSYEKYVNSDEEFLNSFVQFKDGNGWWEESSLESFEKTVLDECCFMIGIADYKDEILKEIKKVKMLIAS